MANEKSKSDSVGYKRPPQAHKFVSGQSGNPHGRPKGTRNFKTDLRDELNETISFHEGGREISISKQRALIKRLVASALGGDARAIATVLSFCARAFGDDGDDEIGSEDRDIVQAFARGPRKHSIKAEATTHSFNEQSSTE
jgi:hypothetical protein